VADSGEHPSLDTSAPAPERVQVKAGGGADYPVLVGPGVLDELPDLLRERALAHRYALVGDARVLELHGGRVHALVESTGRPCTLHPFPAGERSKNREHWARLTDELLATGMGRDGCVVALGGGVTGDLAGFVAATYMRGIPVAQLPTSLVAMIDSAVGGKTGVDVPQGKNLVGAFHPPRFVLADPELALTLPREERAQGLAEALKHGAIQDAEYLASLVASRDALLEGDPTVTAGAVLTSVQVKARVVTLDEREGGIRQILNFGHTLGHAVEHLSGYRIPHGSAVALGMVLEARLGERLEVTEPGTAVALSRAVAAFGLPAELAAVAPLLPPDPGALLLEAMQLDKKVRGGEVRVVLLAQVGEVARTGAGGWSHPVPGDRILEVLG
jgi:3-dehydroquinate synthase